MAGSANSNVLLTSIHGRRLGLSGGLAAGVGDLVEVMGGAYPEVAEQQTVIERTLRTEEEAFERTLVEGTERLEALIGGGHRITRIEGADAFRLHDTFGFPIELTVELGRTTMTIRETLEMGPGSIVALDRMTGEPVDLLVNGHIIAQGEVVAIDEEFGLRITHVVSPKRRLDAAA